MGWHKTLQDNLSKFAKFCYKKKGNYFRKVVTKNIFDQKESRNCSEETNRSQF